MAESCIFCRIIQGYPSISPLDLDNEGWNPEKLSPPAYVLCSTEHAMAFLDIAPLVRGHVLVVPRNHHVKMGDLSSSEAAEVARVLPVIARAVMAAVLPELDHDEVDYNIVQNNGPGAAQVIPHVHFHIIPRPPIGYKPSVLRKYAKAEIPTGLKASFVQFGRGQRNELDDDDAVELVKVMREHVKMEWSRQGLGSIKGRL